MAEKEEPFDTWRYRAYRKDDGTMGISSKVFRSDSIPPGWVDSPAKCKLKGAKEADES